MLGNAVISHYIAPSIQAFYGCSSIEFGTTLEIISDRELKFFDGKAVGYVFGKDSYQDNSGAAVAEVLVNSLGTLRVGL